MDKSTSYLNDLNPSQRAAVEYCDGPSLVIASAGSGKTRVLTYKIAYLLQQGYHPWEIMALTFTNKAANVMKERIDHLLGEGSSRSLWMGTFHSVFLRILRYESDAIGFQPNFTIYDQSGSETLIKNIIKELELDDKQYATKLIVSKISNAKSRLITPDLYAESDNLLKRDALDRTPRTVDIYKTYTERCRLANAMDFDDILLHTFLLFKDNPDILDKYARRFKFVLVDEYQDTNFAQHTIVYQLTSVNKRVCVVGDDAQSIYSFRGANIGNILQFDQIYPDYHIFKLEQNYRSTRTIVSAANSVIAQNENRIKKEAFSDNEQGEKINIYGATSDIEEGHFVANRIDRLHQVEHLGFSSFAILYRTNTQSRIFEERLRERGIPYIVYGGLSFYQRKEIKDVIAYFRLVVNHNDEDAFRRIINYPKRGIGDTSVAKIIHCATTANKSVWDVIGNLDTYDTGISKGTCTKILEFKQMVDTFSEQLNVKNTLQLAKDILQTAGIIRDLYADMTIEGKARQENLEELLNAINSFEKTRIEQGDPHVSLIDYLSEVSLLSDIDETQDKDNCVRLMTVHSAKGLEFNTVFVVGMEENLFPSLRNNTLKEIEEERRLFYVALTRAEKRCFVTYATNRYRFGKTESSVASRFIKELDHRFVNEYISHNAPQKPKPNLFDNSDLPWIRRRTQMFSKPSVRPTYNKPKGQNMQTVDLSATTASHVEQTETNSFYGISVGDHVLHSLFGRGVVEKLEGKDLQCKATIKFQEVGTKNLLLKFAKLKIIK